MTDQRIKNIIIVGGGTAGWMAAAAFAKVLGREYSIRLVESEAIGTVGVGESTVPHLKLLNNLLGIDEGTFLRQTQGTFKLGIQFNDWARLGDSYMHGLGGIGHDVGLLPFHQYWLKALQAGKADAIGRYALNNMAAPRGKFMSSASDVPATSPLANINYAFQFDAGRYAQFLRAFAEKNGVRRTEGRVARTTLHTDNGFVDAVVLESGETIHGDLFIDCSGFRGLLIEQALHTGWEDYSHWLPCDRAVTVASENVGPPTPYTSANARTAGWQWRIPLQHRTGNGHVYSSAHMSDDEAAATLLDHLESRPISDPKLLRFATGMRKKAWNKNVVAVGLSSGFMEPLESTGIYLIQAGISKLLDLFPQRDFSQVVIDRYNAMMRFEFEHIRDFLILHYHLTERDDSAFWTDCRNMRIPPRLEENIDLFRDSGRFFRHDGELFAVTSWVQVLLGHHIMPRSYHPLVEQMPDSDLHAFMASVANVIDDCVDVMPSHAEFIERRCRATS